MVKNLEDLGLDRNIKEQITKTYGGRDRIYLSGSAHRPILGTCEGWIEF
jgi:hypothetical protein